MRNFLLLLFSLYFYYKIGGPAIILLIIIATSDFFIGKAIYFSKKDWQKNFLLLLSIIISVGCLAFFKYTNFVVKNWFAYFYPDVESPTLNIILPIGISFYVFKTLSYIIDIHREMIDEPEKNYINYLLYVSFFPNILAGPITKARDLLPQLKNPFDLSKINPSGGLLFVVIGAFKKICIADFLAANFVDRIFESPHLFTGFENFMAAIGGMIQIYADFSGYTDIVIGLAMMLGFTIGVNFNRPFTAKNITDFWRKWHITLSNWINEYVFYPISFSFRKIKKLGVCLAILIAFIVSGIWHGPNWTYILWGLSHGIALIYDTLTNNIRTKIKKIVNLNIYNFISIILTFCFLCLTVVLFKAPSVSEAIVVYQKIFAELDFSFAASWINLYLMPFIVLISALVLHYIPSRAYDFLKNKYYKAPLIIQVVFVVISIIIIYQAFSSESVPFIYLEF